MKIHITSQYQLNTENVVAVHNFQNYYVLLYSRVEWICFLISIKNPLGIHPYFFCKKKVAELTGSVATNWVIQFSHNYSCIDILDWIERKIDSL